MNKNKKPNEIALDLIEDLKNLIPDGQLLPENIKAYETFYNRLEAQPENVRWLFAYELQFIIDTMVEEFRQASPDQRALLCMSMPEDLSIMKSNISFIKQTLQTDTSYRMRYLSKEFNALPDKHVGNPFQLAEVYKSKDCPRYFRSGVSQPK